MRRFVAIASVLAGVVMLAGCIPVTTKSPVGSTAGLKTDPQLVGAWYGQVNEDKDNANIAFFPTDKGMVGILIGIPASKNGSGGSGSYTSYAVTTAQLGRYRYINAQALIDDGKVAGGAQANDSFPVLYELRDNDTLTLSIVDEDAAKSAIKAGKIAGTVENGNYGDVALTAAPKALDAFFSSPAGRALFVKPLLVLHRVK